MILTPPLSEIGQEICELRARLATADEQQTRFINRQILHRLATRIHYLEAEMALCARSATSAVATNQA